MKEYSIYNYHEINLDKLAHIPVTNVETLFEFSFEENFTNKDFGMNSVLDNDVQLQVINPDVKPNAIVYWIEAATQNNGPNFSFRHFYACTSAFIFKSEMDLSNKDKLQLKVSMSGAQFVFNFFD
ncbi:hypothetical protein M3Y97_01047700 [Aphelenchoides bicaudatus]|nr:hypothetical protein M3Y97_01047700 [Aphelenchoides bicaudatus]